MRSLSKSPNLSILVTQVPDGNLDSRFGPVDEVKKKLDAISKKHNLKSSNIVQMEQVHNTIIKPVGKIQKGQTIRNTDGLMTADPEIVLMLRLADCVPVCIFDIENNAIALVHSGWRGTIGKITLIAIQHMMSEFNTDPKMLKIILGPSIQSCCNVSSTPIQLHLPEWSDCIKAERDAYGINLQRFIVKTAHQAGVLSKDIQVDQTCTVMDRNYFSHQRSKQTGEKEGRFAVLMSLK